ncbi:MAG: hypothetical protein RSA24_04865, partial [Clostridia bacterium]
MSYLKIEELLKENEDYVEYDNTKYFLDTSLQSLLKYNEILENYHKHILGVKSDTEKKAALEKFGTNILEIIFIDKDAGQELTQK